MRESNAESAVRFLEQVVAGEIEAAFKSGVSPKMRHHAPEFAGDADSLRKAMIDNHVDHPDKIFDIQRAISEGNLVAVHSHLKMNRQDVGMGVVHWFRFEQRLIVEMWSVSQPVPEDIVNENGMF